MKPKYHMGQQVVVGTANGDMVGKIITAQVVSGAWRYGVKFEVGESLTTFFYENDMKFYLVEGKWITPRSGSQSIRV